MSFVIMTRPGKEKLVVRLLSERGIKSKLSASIKGAVICAKESPADVKASPWVTKIYDIGDRDLKKRKSPEEESDQQGIVRLTTIKAGDMVRVLAGPYKGFSGIAAKIDRDRALLHLGVYGKILPVEADLKNLEKVGLGELWT